MTALKTLNGRQKAANFLIFIGPEKSAIIFKHMNEEEIEQLTLEIANLRNIDLEQKDDIFREFYEMCLASQYIGREALINAKEVLEKAYGKEKR